MRRTRIAFALFTLVCFFASGSFAVDAATVEKELKPALEGKVFIVRNFYSGTTLQYDSAGNLEGAALSGSWALDGYIRVKSVAVLDDSVKIDATRLVLSFVEEPKKSKQKNSKQQAADACEVAPVPAFQLWNATPLKIVLRRTPEMTAMQTVAAFQKVSLTNKDDMSEYVPDFWKPVVRGIRNPEEYQAKKHAECLLRSADSKTEAKADGAAPEPKVLRTLADGQKAYAVGRDVKPPRARHTPDPQYTQVAREAHFQGACTFQLVIDKGGLTNDIEVIKPCGLGLDEASVDVLRTWTFKPATKGGDPVAVLIHVEINFRL